MQLKPYLEYEPSGTAWLGNVPGHWQVMKLHHIVRMKSGSSITSLDMDDEGEYPVFGGNGIRGRYTAFTHEGSYVLIGRQGAECGNINYAHGKFWASEHAVVATPDRTLDYWWLGETLRGMNLNQYSQSAAQPGLSVEVIGRLKIPFPPIEEQRQIAAFLDWKTGQIDALIARKRELLEKLKEKRLAVITQAVTKGLNPDASLRDSGIPWLGQVPEGWCVKRLKFLASIRYGLGEPPEYVDEGLNFVRATDVSKGRISTAGMKKIRAEDVPWAKGPALRTDEIIVVRSGAYTGDSAIVPEVLDGAIAGFDMVVTATDIDPRLLAWALLSRYLLEAQIFQTRIRAAQPHLNAEELGDFIVVVPEREQQAKIVAYIDNETTRIDNLMAKITHATTRLTEYRTALITAATTGKIDVRDVKVPQPTQT